MSPKHNIDGVWDSQGRPVYVEPPGWRSWKRWAVAVVLAVFLGTSMWIYIVRPVRNETRRRLALTNLALMYKAFSRDYARSPVSLEEFTLFLEQEMNGKRRNECRSASLAVEEARQGRLVIVWKGILTFSTDRYLAYEPSAAATSGLILTPQGMVERVDDIKFARMAPCNQ